MTQTFDFAQNALHRYVVAISAVFVATFASILLSGIVGYTAPTTVFIAAVVLSLLVGGRGPGYLATVMFVVISLPMMVSSGGRLDPSEIIRLAMAVAVCALTCQMAGIREERLQRSLDSLSAAMASAVEGIAQLNPQAVIVSINEQFAHMMGSIPAVLRRRPLLDLVVPEDRQAVADVLRQTFLKGKAEVDARVLWRGAAPHDVSLVFVRASGRHGRPTGVYCFMQDITQHKREQQELRESKERMEVAFAYSTTGMAISQPDGRWIEVNPALCGLLGYSEQEMLMMTFQSITHREDLQRDLELTTRLRDGEISHYTLVKRYVHKSGRTVWVKLDKMAVHDETGRPMYFISQVQDITRERELENQIATIRCA